MARSILQGFREGAPPIHKAACDTDVEALRSFLEQGVDPDARDANYNNRTPLHWLAGNTHSGDGFDREVENQNDRAAIPCIKILLAAGASVDALDRHRSTPMELAIAGDRIQTVSLLMASGANAHRYSYQAHTLLHLASLFGAYRVLPLMLKAGVSVHARTTASDFYNYNRRTPMDQAWWGRSHTEERKYHAICFALLLRAGSVLPTERYDIRISDDPYLSQIVLAGSFANYERAHLEALSATFSPKLAHLLMPELVQTVVGFWLHAGCYEFTTVTVSAPAG